MNYEETRRGQFTILVAPFVTGDLPEAVLAPERFDFFVIDLGSQSQSDMIREVANKIARNATGWVETFGANAETLHDAVDRASVDMGRQQRVGDGVPMTAWHEDLESVDDIVDYILLGGHGSRIAKAVIVIGAKDDAIRIATAIRERPICDE
jgi:hypothetical protein